MKIFLMIMLLAAAGAGSAFAHHEAASQKTGKGTGLIQRIDREKGAVTIKHGPLQGIDMPRMTMSFLVKDKAMLSALQPLQKVDFELTYDGKNYMITNIK